MIKLFLKKLSSASFLFLIPLFCLAALPTWEIKPDESNISFTGTQNNAPVTGQFKTFSGIIHFDPKQLNDSEVEVVVDTNSITTPYKELQDALKTADWFNVKLFPQARFQAKNFTQIGKKTYQVEGILTIRDITEPVTVKFVAEELSKDKVRIKGNLSVNRTIFGVGQGEWSNTKEVKDEVRIDYTITAIKK